MFHALKKSVVGNFGGSSLFARTVKQSAVAEIEPFAFIVTGATAAERQRQLNEIAAQHPNLFPSINAINPQKIGVVLLSDKKSSEKFFTMTEIEAMMERSLSNSSLKRHP